MDPYVVINENCFITFRDSANDHSQVKSLLEFIAPLRADFIQYPEKNSQIQYRVNSTSLTVKWTNMYLESMKPMYYNPTFSRDYGPFR